MKSVLGTAKSTLRTFFKNAVWFGIGLISAGLTAGIIAGFTSLPIGLIIGGLVLIGIWFLLLGYWEEGDRPRFWQRRSTRAGTGAAVSTVAMLAIVGLLNFLAVRSLYRVDLTDAARFTLSAETQEVLKNLSQPAVLYVFDKQQSPDDRELLQNFRRQNPNFSFEFVDPDANPDLAKKFEIKNTAGSRDVHLEIPSKNRRLFVQAITPQQRLSEPQILNSLIQVQSDRKPKVYFTQGHGERMVEPGDKSYSVVVKALQDKNFDPQPLNLAQALKVPPDAAAIVIAGPSKPFFDAEVQAIQEYQNQGGNIMILIDPNVQSNLDNYLKTWGIVLDNRFAIDASGAGQLLKFGPAAPVVQDYNNNVHPITQQLGRNISIYPKARPLEIQSVTGVNATPIVLTGDKSWAESNLEEKPIKLNEGDRPGPLPLGVALSRSIAPSPAPTPSATTSPTASPMASPTTTPTASPSVSPIASPSVSPIASPSASPTVSSEPIASSPTPTVSPTTSPTSNPTSSPTASPTASPTSSPTASPTSSPTASPAPSASPSPGANALPRESRLVVFGNSAFAEDVYVGNQINADVFLNSVIWTSQTQGQSLALRPRDAKRRQLSATPQQVTIVILLSAIALPLLGFALSAWTWWRRR